MNIVRSRLKKSGIFKSIYWKSDGLGWRSERYRNRVQANADALEGDERRLQLLGVSEVDNPFTKASVDSVLFDADRSHGWLWPSRMRIGLTSGNRSEKLVLTYENVFLLETNWLDQVFLGEQLLHSELVRDGKRLRHALLFPDFNYAIVEAESLKFEMIPIEGAT